MSEDVKLEPCDFCGWQTPFLFDTKEEPWWVECPDCFAQGPVGETPEEACHLWNTRIASRPSVEDVERILADPNAVHVNMLRGGIAKPSISQIIHIYGRDDLLAALSPQVEEKVDG